MRRALKAFARRGALYPVYRYVVDRQMTRQFWEWHGDDQKRLEFYRQFITAGDLVFDVGASYGNRAKVFSRLGADVVAVEPHPACADFLLSVFRGTANFFLVRKALGASAGQAALLISSAPSLSTLSADWVRAVTQSGRFAEYEWGQQETVVVDTLDSLLAVDALSVEFTPEFLEGAHRCIGRLCDIGVYRFQVSLGESMGFALPQWVTAEEIGRSLSGMSSTAFGDLYARLESPHGTTR